MNKWLIVVTCYGVHVEQHEVLGRDAQEVSDRFWAAMPSFSPGFKATICPLG